MTQTIHEGNVSTTISWSSEWQEWQVRLRRAGELISTYFTTDYEDAVGTAALMRKEALSECHV